MPRLNYWNSSHADLVWQECGLVWTLDGFPSKLNDQHLTNPVFKDVAWLFLKAWIYPSSCRGLEKTCLPTGSLFPSTDRRPSHLHYYNHSHLYISKHMHHFSWTNLSTVSPCSLDVSISVTCLVNHASNISTNAGSPTLQWESSKTRTCKIQPQNHRLTDAGIYINR